MMRYFWTAAIVTLLLTLSLSPISPHQISHVPTFNGTNAFQYLVDQTDFGPRPPGSENLSQSREMISETFESLGWNVSLQNFTYRETECTNVIATWATSQTPPIILGAHYDTRPNATSDDPANRSKPVLGANDGASGTAVLMELANSLPEDVRSSVEIVLFDAEDSGNINGWEWIQGSTYYVSQLSSARINSIQAMVLVDMVGDVDLRIPREGSSTTSLQNTLWSIADQLGHNDTFLDSSGGSIVDDHRPFLDVGIPAVDLIHYPFPSTWHTLEDTPDRCSAESLRVVGEVLEVFVVEQAGNGFMYPVDDSTTLLIVVGVIIIIVPLVYLLSKRR
ncbi:MAG: M28 family peptidase [Candidatus Thorarchaeota archaeon]